MVADTEFRAMKLKDLPAVMNNEKAGYYQPWSEGIFRDCLKQHAECWLLILQEKILNVLHVERKMQNVNFVTQYYLI